ncbi:MAG TPA: lysophospholipid acyltransferase family protein [Kiloniellaceae bacterium]|nr:lysophospholipid acyltransferase family protein [Kiloniellaceae bacterium]
MPSVPKGDGRADVGSGAGLGSGFRSARRLAVILPLTLGFTFGLLLLRTFGSNSCGAFRLWYYRTLCRAAGLAVVLEGRPTTARPALVVANHASYLDIALLGSILDASFVSRADVARWPFIGWSARLQGTVFVERAARNARRHRDGIAARLSDGDSLILFPEGTSSDGQRVLPFKSTLFAAAELTVDNRPVQVQAVSIAYTKLDGMPMGRYLRPFFAWFGDMTFWRHLWHLLSLGQATAVVRFHEPVTLADFANRKGLTSYCHAQVARGVSSALSGRGRCRQGSDVAAAA